jgi:hypothetical protein
VTYHDGTTVGFTEGPFGTMSFSVGDCMSVTIELTRPSGEVIFSQVVLGNINFTFQPPVGMEFTGARILRCYVVPRNGQQPYYEVLHAWDMGLTDIGVADAAIEQLTPPKAPSRYAPEFAEYYGLEKD